MWLFKPARSSYRVDPYYRVSGRKVAAAHSGLIGMNRYPTVIALCNCLMSWKLFRQQSLQQLNTDERGHLEGCD